MKIRKLILRAKLEQIEKQNQNIFIFHCSANAAQWRFLKNFLYNEGAQRPRSLSAAKGPLGLSSNDASRDFTRNSQVSTNSFSLERGFTFFQSTSFKKKQTLRPKNSHHWCAAFEGLSSPKKVPTGRRFSSERYFMRRTFRSSGNSAHSIFKPKGCLFSFDTFSQSVSEAQKKNNVCNIINKMESLEFNNNLILLYGQMNSTVLNHVDIKEALTLESQTTYQQFFFSMQEVSTAFSYCLHQHIDDFLCFQYLRRHQQNRETPFITEPVNLVTGK